MAEKEDKTDNSEGQRQPPPGTVDANHCTYSRGGRRPRSQQLAETKAHAAPQFKCRPSASQQIIETMEQTSPRKLRFPREARRCFSGFLREQREVLTVAGVMWHLCSDSGGIKNKKKNTGSKSHLKSSTVTVTQYLHCKLEVWRSVHHKINIYLNEAKVPCLDP